MHKQKVMAEVQFRVPANSPKVYTKLLLMIKIVETNDKKCGSTY